MAADSDHLLLADAIPRVTAWDAKNRRSLPWRQTPTPYHVWISEIMLQQTRIEAVIPYYDRFLEALPNIAALAQVEEDRLLKLWEGLGYYSRARNLKKAAMIVMEQYGGYLPADAKALKELPGIGDYTAGAIASLAFGLPEPAVDGNVLRVLSRLLTDSSDNMTQKTRKAAADLLRQHYPSGEDASLLTEGLMELGEVVCIPNGIPLCSGCPLQTVCRAHQTQTELNYPVRSASPERRTEKMTVFLLRCGSRYAIRKRTDPGLLSGLWEFPNSPGFLTPQEAETFLLSLGLLSPSLTPCGKARHVFTHVEWQMTGYLADCEAETSLFTWLTKEEIAEQFSIPTAFRTWQKQLT